MSRFAAVTAVAIAGALALGRCGSSGSDGSGGQSGSSKADTIQFMFRGGPDEKAAYEEAIARFTEETGTKVDIIVTDADQYGTKLQAAVSGGKVPDVF